MNGLRKSFVLPILCAAVGCGLARGRARSSVAPSGAPRRLTIPDAGLPNEAELELLADGTVRARVVGPGAPESWDAAISRGCGVSWGWTRRQVRRRAAGAAEATFDFDWPGLAPAGHLTLVVRRPDAELRYTWRFERRNR